MKTFRRTIHPEVKVLDEKNGIATYTASDESFDSSREVVRAGGWKFDRFSKNAPFVDSHNYESIESLVGKVIDFRVTSRQLVETVQWAIDVPENKLAQIGWAMTKAGYLRAVSVGFIPEDYVTKWDKENPEYKPIWDQQLKELGLTEDTAPRCIYIRQQQIELSACIIGSNPNALAKSYKAGIIGDAELETLSTERLKRETTDSAMDSAAAELVWQRKRQAFLDAFEKQIKAIR